MAKITDVDGLVHLINEIGFLPFCKCSLPGFSLQECTPPGYWFVKDVEGPWEWREAVVKRGDIAYAKLFEGKAGFVSHEWFPHFTNYRREGYDFDARYEDGLASHKAKSLMDVLEKNGPMLTPNLKASAGFGEGGKKGFESTLTALQMQTYAVVHHFQYKQDKFGREYGWGVGCYTTAEERFGEEYVTSAYSADPRESLERMVAHLRGVFPGAGDDMVRRVLK